MILTERLIQAALYIRLKQEGKWPIYPNIDLFTGFEADLLALTTAGYAHEYEIKLTVQDFRADFKKREKHASLSGLGMKAVTGRYGPRFVHEDADDRTAAYYRNSCHPDRRPKRFWYVCAFELEPEQVPPYAGLILASPGKGTTPWTMVNFWEARPAPDLPAQKVDPKLVQKANQNMLYRFWNDRYGQFKKGETR